MSVTTGEEIGPSKKPSRSRQSRQPKRRAKTKGPTLSGKKAHRLEYGRVVHLSDVPIIKGMLIRGDPQSDIAAYFGTNGGRIAQINTGEHYPNVPPAPPDKLPPPGPYLAARSAHRARETLVALRDLIDQAMVEIELWETRR